MAAGQVIPSSASGCPSIDPTNPLCFIYDNGMMYQNSAVNMADITDGTSHDRPLRREPDPDRRLVAGDELLRSHQHRSHDQQADSLQRPELLHLLDEQAPEHGQLRVLRRQRPPGDPA